MGHLFAEDGNGNVRLGLSRLVREADKRTVVGTAGGVLSSTGLGIDDDFILQGPHAVFISVLVAPAAEVLVGSTAGLGDDHPHSFPVGVDGGRLHLQLGEDLRFVFLDQGPVVRGHHPAQEGGLHPGTLVGQGGGIDAKLQGGEPVFALTDGAQDLIAGAPDGVGAGAVDFLLPLGGVPVAGLLHQLNAGRLSQAQGLGGFVHHLPGIALAQLIEEIVAGVAQRPGGIDGAAFRGLVDGTAVGPEQAGRSESGVLGEHALVVNGLSGRQNPFAIRIPVFHSGNQGTHFVCGAGGVLCAEGPVEEGVILVADDLVPVFIHGGQIVGGIAGAGQNVSGLALHHNHRRALGIVTYVLALFGVDQRVPDAQHHFFQGILRHLLDLDIQSGFHVVARHRSLLADDVAVVVIFLGVVLLDDGAVTADHVHTGAVNAVEVVFKGFLKAGLADHGIHGVVQFLVLGPVGIIHAAQVAQHMGSVFGVVFPDGGGFHHQAGGIQLQDGGQILIGHVLHEGVGGQVGKAPQVKLVQKSDDRPGVGVRPVLGNVVTAPQLLHQKGGGDIRVQAPVGHVQQEVILPGAGHGGQGVFKRLGLGDGEVIVVSNAQLPALLHQPVQCLIPVGIGLDNVVVEHQVIRRPVAHQHVAVAVQDIAPGGTDGGQSGVCLGVVGIAIGFHDLQHEQFAGKQGQNKSEQYQEQCSAKTAYSFHVLPPIRPIL